MKILLVGGGSGGSVSPLLAVAEKIKITHAKARFLFVGGKTGPEQQMAGEAGLQFVAVPAGKLRRYFSLRNFIDIFFIVAAFFQSFKILNDFQPDCVFGAGSFIQVPVMWAAWWKNIPVVIHQQDVLPSLANKLCSWIAKKITVTFEQSTRDFSWSLGFFYSGDRSGGKYKVIHTGNPFRQELAHASKDLAHKHFNLHGNLPVLLVTTGGTGAAGLNKIVIESLPQLTKIVQVIHQTGKGKALETKKSANYHSYEFISNMGEAYAAADMVLCRAGVSTITELSNLGKMAIIVPIPGSHQEYNARLLDRENAAFIAAQKQLDAETLPYLVRKLLFHYKLQQGVIAQMRQIIPHDSAQKITDIIVQL